MKNVSNEMEKTVLMIPDTVPSDGSDKPSTSRSFSLNKVIFPSLKSAHSLPVTPIATSYPETAQEQDRETLDCSATVCQLTIFSEILPGVVSFKF